MLSLASIITAALQICIVLKKLHDTDNPKFPENFVAVVVFVPLQVHLCCWPPQRYQLAPGQHIKYVGMCKETLSSIFFFFYPTERRAPLCLCLILPPPLHYLFTSYNPGPNSQASSAADTRGGSCWVCVTFEPWEIYTNVMAHILMQNWLEAKSRR